MTNLDLSLHVFSFLKQVGVDTLVVCAGARNAPLIVALEDQNFKVYNYFEERSAAFFALGLAKSLNRPVAILTTSGTAAAELLAATIEANYQSLPLILITADRPKNYRGSGAPQAIEQVGLFSNYVESVIDIDVTTENFNFKWSMKKPLHLNVAFDEPLIDQQSSKSVQVGFQRTPAAFKTNKLKYNLIRPLIILSEIKDEYKKSTIEFILKTKAPVYAESLSQLKKIPEIQNYLIQSSDQIVKSIFSLKLCDSVIRIGGVPTLRFWRDLEQGYKEVPVVNYSDTPFTGLARTCEINEINFSEISPEFPAEILEQIRNLDAKLQSQKENLFKKYPLSEQSLTKSLSVIVNTDPVYLGNSLPIRNWDQFAICNSSKVNANRGANGIDGQISTYLGWSENLKKSYCYIGDLTAMYDLASLGLITQLSQNQRNIVILNNFGGQIFSRVFKNDHFINAHQIEFHLWAKMWNWNHLKITGLRDLEKINSLDQKFNIIEILPNSEQTQFFWNEWDELCQKV